MSSSLRRSPRRRKHIPIDENDEPPKKTRRLNTQKKKKNDNITTKSKKKQTNTRRRKPKNVFQDNQKITKAKENSDKYVSSSGKVEPSKTKSSPYQRKEPSINQNIADQFHELAEWEKMNLNISRAAQARRTARAIEATSTKIANGTQAAQNIPRVGKKSANDIDEILKHGTLSRLEELKRRKQFHKDEGVNKQGVNEDLACLFEELASYEFDDQDTSRGAQFRLMGKKLRTIKEKITSGEQIEGYHGFGPSAKEIVDEYLTTGHSKRLDNFRKAYGTPKENLRVLYTRQHKWKKKGKYPKKS